jgi:hypothetical protein
MVWVDSPLFAADFDIADEGFSSDSLFVTHRWSSLS